MRGFSKIFPQLKVESYCLYWYMHQPYSIAKEDSIYHTIPSLNTWLRIPKKGNNITIRFTINLARLLYQFVVVFMHLSTGASCTLSYEYPADCD